MKIVVGLGNPGAEYNFTRHNLGFLALDFYFKLYQLSWGAKPLHGAITGQKEGVLFVKPQDFYNDSGRAVRSLARYFKVPASDILVVCDDFCLDFGVLRYREHGSAGGNNGLKSLILELKTENFPRLRLGTGNDTLRRKIGDVDFVLSRFTPEEKAKLPEILQATAVKINDFFSR